MIDEPRGRVEALPTQRQKTGHGVLKLAMLEEALEVCVGLGVQASESQVGGGLGPEEGGGGGGGEERVGRLSEEGMRRAGLAQRRVVVAAVLLLYTTQHPASLFVWRVGWCEKGMTRRSWMGQGGKQCFRVFLARVPFVMAPFAFECPPCAWSAYSRTGRTTTTTRRRSRRSWWWWWWWPAE